MWVQPTFLINVQVQLFAFSKLCTPSHLMVEAAERIAIELNDETPLSKKKYV
jgi:hypothetical protein